MSIRKNGNKTKGVHHVGLTVRSLDEARHFFVDSLGLRTGRRNTRLSGCFSI